MQLSYWYILLSVAHKIKAQYECWPVALKM